MFDLHLRIQQDTAQEGPKRALRPGWRVVYAPHLSRAASSEPSRLEPSRRPKRVGLALGFNQVLSSGTHLTAKAAMSALGALPVALLRFTIASIAFLVVGRIR